MGAVLCVTVENTVRGPAQRRLELKMPHFFLLEVNTQDVTTGHDQLGYR